MAYINKTREGTGEAILQHPDFMRKVPKVLGTIAPKFFGTNIYINGRGGKQEQTIYNFPKREAMHPSAHACQGFHRGANLYKQFDLAWSHYETEPIRCQ